MTAYSLTIEDGDTYLANASGNFNVIRAAVTEAFPDGFEAKGDELTIELIKTNGISGEQDGKPVIKLTADPDTVQTLAKARLRELRKSDPDVPARTYKRRAADDTSAESGEQGTDASAESEPQSVTY